MKYMSRSGNRLVVSSLKQALEVMEYEITRELGVQLGADTKSCLNGSVGRNDKVISLFRRTKFK